MLNSAEHEISKAHSCKNIRKISLFGAQISLECCFLFINVKIPTIVGILTFMSRKNTCSAEHEKSFITSGPGEPAFNFYPFLTSGLVHPIIWMSPFLILGGSGECFHFYCILHRNSCEQRV